MTSSSLKCILIPVFLLLCSLTFAPTKVNATVNSSYTVYLKHRPPYAIVSHVDGQTSYTGFNVDLIDKIALDLGFEYDVVVVNVTVSDSELLSLVQSKDNAILIDRFHVTSELVDENTFFTQPYLHVSYALLEQMPAVQYSIWNFTKPFSNGLWLMTITFGVFYGIAIAFLEGQTDTFEEQAPNKYIAGMFFAFFGMFGFPDREVRTTAGKILSFGWYFLGVMLVASYTANLAAFLASASINTKITSFADLKGVEVCVECNGAAQTFLNSNPGMVASYSCENIVDDCISKTVDGTYTLTIDEDIELSFFNIQDCANTYIIPSVTFGQQGLAYVLSNNLNAEKAAVDRRIIHYSTIGYIHELRIKWFGHLDSCPPISDGSGVLGINETAGLFIVFGITFGISAITFSMQIALAKKKASVVSHKTVADKSGSSEPSTLEGKISALEGKMDMVLAKLSAT